MPHPNILDPSRSALIVIDIQERFRGVIADFDRVALRAAVAVQGFQILGLPMVVTEQYPQGLGHTVSEVTDVLSPGTAIVEKTAFSACGADAVTAKLEKDGVSQIVICGLETHVCVNQTAHDLLHRGFQVHLLLDCVCSRSEEDKIAGLAKMRASGVIASSVEIALFELMGGAGHRHFRAIQALIK